MDALMSIWPEYAEQILAGVKTVEFRKKPIKADKVLIYATSPVKKVVGKFTVVEQVISSPGELWRRYREYGGIDEKDFFAYYESAAAGVALVIGDAVRFPQSLNLASYGLLRPPQSCQYLEGR